MATRVESQAGSRHRALGLSDQELLDMYRTMGMA